MTDKDSPPPSLDDIESLDARLRELRDSRGPKPSRSPLGGGADMSGVGMAFRIGTELVAGLAIGVGIGWGLDYWLETGPWFLVVFFFLGSGAGILNVYRAASGIGLAPGYRDRTGSGNGTAADGDRPHQESDGSEEDPDEDRTG